MNTLYKDILHDHYRNPRNKGTLENPDFASDDYNPSCGDGVSMQGTVKKNIITRVVFQGAGCVIRQATSSLLTEYASGKTVEQILAISDDDVQTMIGMQLGPMRLKCAQLPLSVLQQGVKKLRT
jgi:nitrogen fixation NifU-like protein